MKTKLRFFSLITFFLLAFTCISLAQVDSDGDGINDDIDLSPNIPSVNFDDNLVVRGMLDTTTSPALYNAVPSDVGLTISNNGANGVIVESDGSFNEDVTILFYCYNNNPDKLKIISANTVTTVILDCNSSIIEVIEGIAIGEFFLEDGSTSIVEIPAGNKIEVKKETGTFIAPEDNTVALVVETGGEQLTVEPGVVESYDPFIKSISLPEGPVAINTSVDVKATFVDTDDSRPHQAVWNWGDGSQSAGEVIYDNAPSMEVSGAHTYTEPGVYVVSLTVTDNDNNGEERKSTEDGDLTTSYVVVYDPDEGFVTGGGWINSPEGSLVSEPEATGKAAFGFVSKYIKGKNTLTGETEFQFIAGDLGFHSSYYDWLLINKHKAMFKGAGTINGTGNYGFQLSAIDAALTPETSDEDQFRIRIWDKDNNDELIYDNQMGAGQNDDPSCTIEGGNIKIFKPNEKGNNLNSAGQNISQNDLIREVNELLVYPNPFREQVEIQYRTFEGQQHSISIMDLFGQEIKVIINNSYLPGFHNVIWNGRDERNQRLPSGVYFVKLQVGGQHSLQKIILIE